MCLVSHKITTGVILDVSRWVCVHTHKYFSTKRFDVFVGMLRLAVTLLILVTYN